MTRSHLIYVLALATLAIASPALAQSPSPQVVYLVPGPTPGTWTVAGPGAVPTPRPVAPAVQPEVPRRPFSFDLTGGSSLIGGSSGKGDSTVSGLINSHYDSKWAPSFGAQLLVHFDGTVGGPSLGATLTTQVGPHPTVQIMGRTGYDFAARIASASTIVLAPYVAFGSLLDAGNDYQYFVLEGGLDLRTYLGDSVHFVMRGFGGYAFDGASARFDYFGALGGVGLSY